MFAEFRRPVYRPVRSTRHNVTKRRGRGHRVGRLSMFRADKRTLSPGPVQAGPEIFEAARPTKFQVGGPCLIANGGVGLGKAFHLDQSPSRSLRAVPCLKS
jgi:hypothetical protein